jgi:hypothetical protein
MSTELFGIGQRDARGYHPNANDPSRRGQA